MKNNKIKLINDKGEECLFDGKEKVYASIYDATGKDMNLYPIETEKEWNLIFNILESIQKKMEEEKNV